MKKLLLIAAMAAVALGASAGYNLEKLWENTDVASLYLTGVRQGFGMDGKFYINDTQWGGEGNPTIYVYDKDGQVATYPGYANTAITRDEAGHIIVSTLSAFNTNIAGSGIKVLDAETMEVLAEYEIPVECGLIGRCDFFGFAKGDMTQDGVMYLTGGNTGTDPYTNGIAIFAVSGGEVDFDECRLAPVDGNINGQTSTVIVPYTDLEGNDALLYAYRSTYGYIFKLLPDGDVYNKQSFITPPFGSYTKGHSNGLFPVIWDGKELVIYPLMPDYRDGWAMSENDAEEPLVAFEYTVEVNPNGYQANWLNAEVDEDGVTIYQYVPGLCLRVFRLTKEVAYTVGANILNNWTLSEENNMVLGEDGKYTLTKTGVEIPANYNIEYKVTSNGTWWPAVDNATYYIEDSGVYTLVFTFDPETGEVDLVATKTGEIHYTGDVYILGQVNGKDWAPNDGVKMDADVENNVYTATVTTEGEYSYFSFSKIIAQNDAQNGGWAELNGYRMAAEENNFLIDENLLNTELLLQTQYPDNAFMLPAGMWKLTVSVDNLTLRVEKASIRGDVNMDGYVKIDDVTALIDYLLSGNEEGIDIVAADCNKSGDVKIDDVTTLIDFLLGGNWPD